MKFVQSAFAAIAMLTIFAACSRVEPKHPFSRVYEQLQKDMPEADVLKLIKENLSDFKPQVFNILTEDKQSGTAYVWVDAENPRDTNNGIMLSVVLVNGKLYDAGYVHRVLKSLRPFPEPPAENSQ